MLDFVDPLRPGRRLAGEDVRVIVGTSNLETNEIEGARVSKDRASDGRSRFFYFALWITRTTLLEAISIQTLLDVQTSTKIR